MKLSGSLLRRDSSAKASGKTSKQESVLPKGLTISEGPRERTSPSCSIDGDVDALFHAADPKRTSMVIHKLHGLCRTTARRSELLCQDRHLSHHAHRGHHVEMSLLAHPWLPAAVFNAYWQAKQLDYDYLKKAAWYKNSLPWFGQEFDETRA